MGNELVRIKNQLSHAGVLGREYGRVKTNDKLQWKVEQSYALDIISRWDEPDKVDPTSVGRSLIDAAVMGLTLSPSMRLAYLIPYWDKTIQALNCTVSPSYMGLEQIAYKTGFVDLIQCNLVYENDTFECWTDDEGRHIRHTEMPGNRGEITHAYCIAWFTNGRKHIEVMTKKDIIACREAAAKQNNNTVPFVWKGKFRTEMYKKCVLRRGWKHWPRTDNPRIREVMEAVDRTDPMEFKESDEKVVTEPTTIDADQIDQLKVVMKDGGVPQAGWDAWLHGLANRMGYKGINYVNVGDFDKALSAMEEGVRRWQTKQSSPDPSKESG